MQVFFVGLTHSSSDPADTFLSVQVFLILMPIEYGFSISFAFKKIISCTFVRAITAFNHPAAPDLCICTKLSGNICLHPAVVKVL